VQGGVVRRGGGRASGGEGNAEAKKQKGNAFGECSGGGNLHGVEQKGRERSLKKKKNGGGVNRAPNHQCGFWGKSAAKK